MKRYYAFAILCYVICVYTFVGLRDKKSFCICQFGQVQYINRCRYGQ